VTSGFYGDCENYRFSLSISLCFEIAWPMSGKPEQELLVGAACLNRALQSPRVAANRLEVR
jgi:hypothetical protein